MSGPARRVWVEQIMGTAVSIHAYGVPAFLDDARVAEAAASAFDDLHRVEAVFSPYRDDSDITRLRHRALAPADAHPWVRDVAAQCGNAEVETGGRFSAWWQGWFDPTGYVKGWAVERAARMRLLPLLARAGAAAVGINAGGDLQLGTAAGADWVWHVGIADPFRPGEVLATIDLLDGAVATSGSAERGAHIVDPRTGAPASGLVSATVVHDSLTRADLWATAAIVAGDDPGWIGRAGARSVLTVTPAGRVRRWAGAMEVTAVASASADAAPGALPRDLRAAVG